MGEAEGGGSQHEAQRAGTWHHPQHRPQRWLGVWLTEHASPSCRTGAQGIIGVPKSQLESRCPGAQWTGEWISPSNEFTGLQV